MKQQFSKILSCRAVQLVLRVLSYLSILRVLRPDVRVLEYFYTAAALWWTLLLLGTPKMFGTNPSFAGLAERGREREWGIVTGALSALGVWVVLGASATLRFFAAFVAFVLWFFVALNLSQAAPWVHPKLFGVELAFSIPQSSGAGLYGTLAGFAAWAAAQLGPHVISDLHFAAHKCASARARRSQNRQFRNAR